MFSFLHPGFVGLKEERWAEMSKCGGGDHKWIEGPSGVWASKKPESFKSILRNPVLTKWIYEKNKLNLGSSGFINTQEVQSQRVGSDDSISRPLTSRHSSSAVLWRNMETKPFVTWSRFSIKRMAPTKQHAMRYKGTKIAGKRGHDTIPLKTGEWDNRFQQFFSCQNFFDGYPLQNKTSTRFRLVRRTTLNNMESETGGLWSWTKNKKQ